MDKFSQRLTAVVILVLFALIAYFLWDHFRDRSIEEQLSEIILDEDRRELTERLEKYLQAEDPDVRGRAALAVGRIGARGSGALLIDMIYDANLDVAATAAFALGLTDEKGYASHLVDLANDLPSAVAFRAVEAVGRLADSAMYDVARQLVEMLLHPSPEVREAACMAIYRAGAKSKAPALLAFVAGEEDRPVRKAVLYTLAQFGYEEAAPLFEEYLADSDPFARATAVRGLGKSKAASAEHYLAIAMNDSDHGVVAGAIAQLGGFETVAAKQQLAERLERETDEKLIIALMQAIQRQNSAIGAAEVRSKLTNYTSPGIVAAGLKCLGAVTKDRAVINIDSLTTREIPYIRAACAEAYGLIGMENIISRLAVLSSDEDGMVRTAALISLIKLDTANTDFHFNKALTDQDFVVVVTAVEHIRDHLLTEYLPVLNTIMSRGPAIDVDIRRTIVETAGAFLEENINDTTAHDILVQGVFDQDYVIRRTAAEIYRDVLQQDRFNLVPPAATWFGIGAIEDALHKYKINPYAAIVTEKGTVEMELFFDVAPLTVLNFIRLVEEEFYNGLIFHRVVPGFVVQGGDPRGDGWGGQGRYMRCEYSIEPYIRGTVGVATSGKDTGGSQFFVTLAPQPHLEGRYTVMGQVIAGMEVVDQLVYGDQILKIEIREK